MTLNSVEQKIISAFLELYAQKDLSKIKVKEICECAQVSRVTFYTYFEDLDKLLSYIEYQTLEDVTKIFKEWEYLDITMFKDRTIPMFVSVYDYVLKHKDVYKATFGKYGRYSFILKYNAQVKESIYRMLKKRKVGVCDIDFVAVACQGGIIQTSINWIENDFNYSVDEIAYLCSKCIFAMIDIWRKQSDKGNWN